LHGNSLRAYDAQQPLLAQCQRRTSGGRSDSSAYGRIGYIGSQAGLILIGD
jgi:hypothetical protein